MNQRTSKLVEYLENQNYEMAIAAYNHTPEILSDSNSLELARAFLVNENYKKSFQIASAFINSENPVMKYQAGLICVKCKYIVKQNKDAIAIIKDLIDFVKNNPGVYHQWHYFRVQQIYDGIKKEQSFVKSQTMNKNQMMNFVRSFNTELQAFQQEPLSIGMPMFLISERWFENMKKFCGFNQQFGDYPGIMGHFQIIDDRFNSVYDPTPHKKYTNYLIYPSARVKALSKSCWLMLNKIFTGVQLKRFNVSVLGNPNQIFTQIFLRRIKVEKDMKFKEKFILQISRKQIWSAAVNKLRAAWKSMGNLFLNTNSKLTLVEQRTPIQQFDISDKIYIFTEKNYGQIQSQGTVDEKIYKCNLCSKKQNLKFCQCKSVKYCDMNCLKQDREKHRKRCELQVSHIRQKAAVLSNFHLSEKKFSGRKGLVGLRNLGNTCYMNSGLQCLSNTRQLTEYFMSNNFLKDINNTNPLGTKGNLACAYAELIRQMWSGDDAYLSPFNLKKIIGKFASQFSGLGQQDSQQLISYMIDGLQEDLNLVRNKETFQTKDQILPDQEASRLSQLNYSKRIQSFIRDLMVGQFKSTVICLQCHKKSVCFDPYMLISLPVPSINKEKQVYFISADTRYKNIRIYVQYDNVSTFGEVKNKIGIMQKVRPETLLHIQSTIISLDDKNFMKRNIDDQQLFANTILHLKQDDCIIFFQIQKPGKDQQIFEVQIFSRGEKINFSKFINLSPSLSKKALSEKLVTFFDRFYEGRNALQLYEQMPQIINGKIAINLRTKISMLKCKTEQQKIKVYHQKRLTLDYCLKSYGMTQILQKNNQWYCNKCKKFVKASKQMQIYKTNKILVLAFKRFSRGWKIKNSIQFPVQQLNIGPYITSNKPGKPLIYELYGVVNHYGTMYGGHYTAYCKNFLNQRWFEFDDSRISEARAKDVISDAAYVLFYRLKDN